MPTQLDRRQLPSAPTAQTPIDHSKMDHSKMADDDTHVTPRGPAVATSSEGSGTARLPGKEGGMHGLHIMSGDWQP